MLAQPVMNMASLDDELLHERTYKMLDEVDTTHPQVKAAVDKARLFVFDVVNGTAKNSLIFYGGFGCGKTKIATAIAMGLDWNQISFRHWYMPELVSYLKNCYENNKQIEALDDGASVLILDDIGAEYAKNTDWLEGIYTELIQTRYEKRGLMVITTNLKPGEMPVGKRAISRLTEMVGRDGMVNMSEVPDYRRKLGGW